MFALDEDAAAERLARQVSGFSTSICTNDSAGTLRWTVTEPPTAAICFVMAVGSC